ncbi:SPOR domain-containing protein [Nibrella saemangeumensis]|uniref:SPOR domain-containing protein n=1 Tax=Nibrella saemangeumensis TaxID=1084526 RepID=A0ABP8MJP3_9BACT
MTPVSAYVKKLLYQYDCIVVPELGAFLTHQLPATFVEATGLYMPPRKKLAFNEALRLDDGILTNYVMLHEGCSREDAQRHIAAFVSELKLEVRQSGSLSLEGIGLFTQNDEGKLQFDPELRHNFLGEVYGMQPLQVGEWVKQTTTEPVSLVPVVTTSESDAIETEEVIRTVQDEQPRRVYWPWVAAAVFVGALAGISYFSVIQTKGPLQSSLSPSSLFQMSFIFNKPVEEPVKTVVPPTTEADVSSDKLLAMAEPHETVPPVVPSVAAEVKKPAPVAAKTVPVTNVSENEVKTKSAIVRPHFIVIAGSFSNRLNAGRFQRQMRKEGYTDAYVIKPMRKGQLFKVGVYSSANRFDAVGKLDEVSEITGLEAWIMEY